MLRSRALSRGLLACGIALSTLALSTGAKAADVSGAVPVLDAEEKAFITLINNYRATNCATCAPLQVSITLTRASQWLDEDLEMRSLLPTSDPRYSTKLRHDDSIGRFHVERLTDYGYGYNTWTGENIAAGYADAFNTFEQFRTSPTHNVHMLDPHYTTMGIARHYTAGSKYGWYWTNDFGGVNDPQIGGSGGNGGGGGGVTDPPVVIVTPGRSVFVPVAPARILDTRPHNDVAAGGTIDIPILGRAGVPAAAAEVAAVVMTVTITEAASGGYVTAYPYASNRPESSSLNVEGPGTTVANLVTVPLGSAGKVSLFSSGGGHLLADVVGYYKTVNGTATAGRFQPSTPTRILDTRLTGGRLAAGGTRVIHLLGQPGIPTSGVSAVSVNFTVTGAVRPGYLAAYPAASGVPSSSNLNVNVAGDTVAGAAILPLDANGNIGVLVDSGGDLIVDVNGWFTDSSATASTAGIFVARTPSRELDTRRVSTMAEHTTRDLAVPPSAIAVSSNLTLTRTASGGFLSAYGAGGSLPTVSSVNATHANHTVANHALVPASASGIRMYADMQTDVIVDYDGYYMAAGA